MNTLMICLGFIIWCGIWMVLIIRACQKEFTKSIGCLANILPPFALISCGLLFWLLPQPAVPPAVITRAVHYCGIILLFSFLSFGAFCQVSAWLEIGAKSPSLERLAQIYRKWWVATRILPAPAAICILASGIRLTYECPVTGSLSLGFLFWLVAGFSFFFFDGLIFYLPEICYQNKAIHGMLEHPTDLEEKHRFDGFTRAYRKRGREILLFLHSLSFPFVFALGAVKPIGLWIPSWVSSFLQAQFTNFNPGAARSARAALLVGLIGLVILALRLPQLVGYIRFFKHSKMNSGSEDK